MKVIDEGVNTTIKITGFVTSNNAANEEKVVDMEQQLYCQIGEINEQHEQEEGG